MVLRARDDKFKSIKIVYRISNRSARVARIVEYGPEMLAAAAPRPFPKAAGGEGGGRAQNNGIWANGRQGRESANS